MSFCIESLAMDQTLAWNPNNNQKQYLFDVIFHVLCAQFENMLSSSPGQDSAEKKKTYINRKTINIMSDSMEK